MDPKDVKLIDDARARFDAVSEKARTAIYRKVLEHYQRHPGSPWSGAPLRDLEMMIRQFYADLGLQYDKVFRDTLQPIMQQYYDRAVEELKTAGLRNAIEGKPDTARVKYFMDSAFEQVAMKTQNMTFQHIRALRNITADVTRQMSITGATRQQVSKELLSRAMEIPGFQFIDKSGAKWPLKSYFNMLARTELMNAARSSYDDKCSEEAADIMLLTVSGHCCEHCAKYEGKLFSLSGRVKGMPSKQDLIDDGVFHPNCTHSYSLVPEYIAMKNYGIKKDDIDKAHSLKQKNESGTATTSLNRKTIQQAPFGLWKGKQEQFEAKFDGDLTAQGKELEKQMKKAGISAEVRDEIHWNHTPKMQKLCGENPRLKGGSNWPGTIPGTRNTEVGDDPTTWEGCRQTATHEYGHYVANSIFDLEKNRNFEEFKKAAISDWIATRQKTKSIERFKGLADDSKEKVKMENALAKEKYGKDNYDELSLDQRWKITADADILGSISGGLYGFGHGHQVYIDDEYREAFANMYLAYKYNWTEFGERYPSLWKYMENLLK